MNTPAGSAPAVCASLLSAACGSHVAASAAGRLPNIGIAPPTSGLARALKQPRPPSRPGPAPSIRLHEPRRPSRRPPSCRRAAARSPAAAAAGRQRPRPGHLAAHRAPRRAAPSMLGGVDVRALAAQLGTPVFACDEEDFRSRCRDFREAFGDGAGVFYAAKAFCCRAVLRWVSEEGLGVDVCTGGELEVALQAGVPAGDDHAARQQQAARRAGPGGGGGCRAHRGRLVLMKIGLALIAERDAPPGDSTGPGGDSRPRVLVRVTTGVEAAAHEFVATAHDDQKFGFSLASGAADEAVRQVLGQRGARVRRPALAHRIADLRHGGLRRGRAPGARARGPDPRRPAGSRSSELNLGGGFGIAYMPGDDPADIKVVAQNLREILNAQCRAAGLARPRLTVEPGRAIAGPGHGHALPGRDRQGRRRPADLRQRGRRDERQHPHRAVRRRVHLRARLAGIRLAARAVPGGRPGTARAGTSWSGTRTCPPT